jgi:NAD(P)-dependent dehydrogenase (short-subunit alcohol dehydrogenase family)
MDNPLPFCQNVLVWRIRRRAVIPCSTHSGPCFFLASEAAGFITGQNPVIDGGMTVKMIYVG